MVWILKNHPEAQSFFIYTACNFKENLGCLCLWKDTLEQSLTWSWWIGKKLLQQYVSKHTSLLPSESCARVVMECVCVYIYQHKHETYVSLCMGYASNSRWEDCGHPVLSATFLPDAPVIACGLRCLANHQEPLEELWATEIGARFGRCYSMLRI